MLLQLLNICLLFEALWIRDDCLNKDGHSKCVLQVRDFQQSSIYMSLRPLNWSSFFNFSVLARPRFTTPPFYKSEFFKYPFYKSSF